MTVQTLHTFSKYVKNADLYRLVLIDHALQEAVLEAAHKKRLAEYRKREKNGKLTERDLHPVWLL